MLDELAAIGGAYRLAADEIRRRILVLQRAVQDTAAGLIRCPESFQE